MKDPTMKVRGRPAMGRAQLSPISSRVPIATHDKLIKVANRQEMSVAALIRRIIVITIDR
jgi:hypothetical protein